MFILVLHLKGEVIKSEATYLFRRVVVVYYTIHTPAMKSAAVIASLCLVALLAAAVPVAQAGPKIIENVVLAGGGAFGPAHVGVLSVLQSNPGLYQPKALIGTSIGSFVGSLYVAGFSPAEMRVLYPPANANTARANLTLVGQNSVFGFGGMVDSGSIIPVMNYLFYSKTGFPAMTFAQLASVRSIDLTIVSFNLNTMQVEYFNNHTSPNMQVAVAVELSSAIPSLYTSPLYNGHRYIDGGVRDVYPFGYFSSQGQEVLKRTVGSNFVSQANVDVVNDVNDLASNLILVMQQNNLPKIKESVARRTISSVMPVGVRDTQAIVTAADNEAFYQIGVAAANAFLADDDCPFHA